MRVPRCGLLALIAGSVPGCSGPEPELPSCLSDSGGEQCKPCDLGFACTTAATFWQQTPSAERSHSADAGAGGVTPAMLQTHCLEEMHPHASQPATSGPASFQAQQCQEFNIGEAEPCCQGAGALRLQPSCPSRPSSTWLLPSCLVADGRFCSWSGERSHAAHSGAPQARGSRLWGWGPGNTGVCSVPDCCFVPDQTDAPLTQALADQ